LYRYSTAEKEAAQDQFDAAADALEAEAKLDEEEEEAAAGAGGELSIEDRMAEEAGKAIKAAEAAAAAGK
jgi:hypothetical protein